MNGCDKHHKCELGFFFFLNIDPKKFDSGRFSNLRIKTKRKLRGTEEAMPLYLEKG